LDKCQEDNKRLNAVLDRLGDRELIAITPLKTTMDEIRKLELDARIEYARNRGESEEGR